jgi:prepilin-type processing-associated H-X9-DG protein
MPYDVFLKVEAVEGERSAPSVSEIVVTKSLDSTSPLFFDEKDAGDLFAYDGDGATATPHTGGINVLLCDGSVRPLHGVTGDFNAYLDFEDYDASKTVDYNPFVTVDYLF